MWLSDKEACMTEWEAKAAAASYLGATCPPVPGSATEPAAEVRNCVRAPACDF